MCESLFKSQKFFRFLFPGCILKLPINVIFSYFVEKKLHSVHWGINPPHSKTHSRKSSCQAPSLNLQIVQAPFLSHALYTGFSWIPLTVRFFSESQKYQRFSFLTPSYLLKVTEFLVKISQFEFLVMTEKNIFAYKLFLSLNILDFNLFFNKHSNPLKKVTLLFCSNLTLKVEVLSSLSFFKIWRFNHPPPPPLPPLPSRRGEGRCTLWVMSLI